MLYEGTLLVETNDPESINKALLDLLQKINAIADEAGLSITNIGTGGGREAEVARTAYYAD